MTLFFLTAAPALVLLGIGWAIALFLPENFRPIRAKQEGSGSVDRNSKTLRPAQKLE